MILPYMLCSWLHLLSHIRPYLVISANCYLLQKNKKGLLKVLFVVVDRGIEPLCQD